MRIVYFTHSLRSCWNHGNAHFLRGVLSELVARGHDAEAFEPEGAWSLQNLLKDHGEEALEPFQLNYPELRATVYSPGDDVSRLIGDADLVIVHEWNEPELVAEIGRIRARGGRFTLLFHDTHHRAVSEPEEMREYELDHYDGVLAFGEAVAAIYRKWGWGDRAFVWHEAADTRRFHPPAAEKEREGLIWIGNWGDGERSKEISDVLLRPSRATGLPLDIYGVRYPQTAKQTLRRFGASYHGWAANASAPDLFARHLATVHVPRRYYTRLLPGVPTIRVFEALACGIPLVSAPWQDSESLFRVGQDFLTAKDGEEMTRQLTRLKNESELRRSLAASGLETIRKRHSCAHRVDELLAIARRIGTPALRSVA